MNRSNIAITIVSIIVIFGFLSIVYIAGNKSAAPQINQEVVKIKAKDHIKWNASAKNVLVEYSDLQCPACRAFHSFLKEIESSQSANNKIVQTTKFVYRHYPLSIHKNAKAAAYAAEAAEKQGKFFKMHDALFEKQEEWEKSNDPLKFFIEYAKNLGLDEVRFKENMGSKSVKDAVENDIVSGNQAGVSATPTFFLNGQKLEFANLDDFINLLKNPPSQ